MTTIIVFYRSDIHIKTNGLPVIQNQIINADEVLTKGVEVELNYLLGDNWEQREKQLESYLRLLMDIGLPGINGFEALEILKTETETKDIPVIALSANAMPHDVEKGRQAGFTAYLTKPVDINKLLETVTQILSQQD